MIFDCKIFLFTAVRSGQGSVLWGKQRGFLAYLLYISDEVWNTLVPILIFYFLTAFYSATGTLPSSIARISSKFLPVMDAIFSGVIPLRFILRIIFASAIFSCLYDNLFIFLHQAVSCIPNTRNNLIVTVLIKLLTESIIKKK